MISLLLSCLAIIMFSLISQSLMKCRDQILRDHAPHINEETFEMSMGMSGDYAVAVR